MKTMLSRLRSNCAVFAALASFLGGPVAVAQDYTVEVTPHLDGLDIKIEPVSNPGVLVVNLTNNTAQKVRCDLNFEADPQLPFQTFVFVGRARRVPRRCVPRSSGSTFLWTSGARQTSERLAADLPALDLPISLIAPLADGSRLEGEGNG